MIQLKPLATLLVLSTVGLATIGCQNDDKMAALTKQNQELQTQLSDRDAKLRGAPDPGQLAAMQNDIAARDARIAELQAALQNPAPGPGPAPAGQPKDETLGGITVTKNEREGTLTVTLPGDVLFTSGSATLKDSAKSTLNKIVAAVRKDYSGKKVFVEGHTDSDPITKTKDKWEDNLDLSAARARTVARYLETQGMSSANVGTRAFGDTSPKGDKARSRRVEIVVHTR